MVELKLVLLLVSIKDLNILLIINLVPKDIHAVVSPSQNVKYMFRRGYPSFSGHTLTLPVVVPYVKENRTVPFYANPNLKQEIHQIHQEDFSLMANHP